MHDLIFAHQAHLADDDLRAHTEQLGVDGASVVRDAGGVHRESQCDARDDMCVTLGGMYGSPPTQMFMCVSTDGSSHRFAGTLPQLTARSPARHASRLRPTLS